MLCEIFQQQSLAHYAHLLGCDLFQTPGHSAHQKRTSKPGDKHWMFQLIAPHLVVAVKVRWCWLPGIAKEHGEKPSTVADRSKLMDRYFFGVMKSGRFIVPADGWVEALPPDLAARNVVSRSDRHPMFFAALSNYLPGDPNPERDGFVIVVGNQGKFEEKNLARPIVLDTIDALAWMDKSCSYNRAVKIAQDSNIDLGALDHMADRRHDLEARELYKTVF